MPMLTFCGNTNFCVGRFEFYLCRTFAIGTAVGTKHFVVAIFPAKLSFVDLLLVDWAFLFFFWRLASFVRGVMFHPVHPWGGGKKRVFFLHISFL